MWFRLLLCLIVFICNVNGDPIVEGDILVRPSNGTQNSGLSNPTTKWPNSMVPYSYTDQMEGSEKEKIEAAMKEIQEKTCVKFINKENSHTDFVQFTNLGSSCASYVGRQGGKQDIFLASGRCYRRKTILHELMHALGFIHEHNRSDRDDHVTIMLGNVPKIDHHNFEKRKPGDIDKYDTDYAFESIMHYSPYAMAIDDNLPTIVSKRGGVKMGGGDRLSEIDVKRINRRYCGGNVVLPELPNVHWNRRGDGVTWAASCDMPGRDVGFVIGITPENCQTHCLQHAYCDHFTWTPNSGGVCCVKLGYDSPNVKAVPESYKYSCGVIVQRVTPVVSKLNWTSRGDLVTWAANCDMPGRDVEFVTGITPKDCQTYCLNHSSCDHFTWTPNSGGVCCVKKGYASSNVKVVPENYKYSCGIVIRKK